MKQNKTEVLVVIDSNHRLVGVFKTPNVSSSIIKLGVSSAALKIGRGMNEQLVIDDYVPLKERKFKNSGTGAKTKCECLDPLPKR